MTSVTLPSEPATPVAPASGPLPRAQRQETILRGAAEAFARKGYAATSMEDIAASSGITKLIVYRHFESKEALYRAVLQRVFDRLAEEFVAAYAQRRGPRGAVGVRAMLRAARADPAGFRLLWRHAAREERFADYAADLRERAVVASRGLIGTSVDRRFREWAAQTIVGYLVEATLNWIDLGSAELDETYTALAAGAVRDAVAAWTGSGERRPVS